MTRFIYNLLWPIGLLCFLPGYLVKMFRRGGYREKFGQRLGIYDAGVRQRLAQRRSTWLHAVSVGEVAVALKLASQLQAIDPDLHCVLTTTTTTGFSFGRKHAPAWIEVMYNPVDFWPIMRRAFAVIRPARIVLIEAEVWPNLAAEAHAREIPIALANARLSVRSELRFRRFRFLVRPVFRLLDLVCVQQRTDVDRWVGLGVEPGNIHNVGSIKFDPDNLRLDSKLAGNILSELGINRQRPIILGGSTHTGEEETLARVFVDLVKEFPDLFLIIAPRHSERAREVRRLVEQIGLRVVLRSESRIIDKKPDCLLLDSTGELQNWYAAATVVFIGKSLTAHGGQNPAEAIAAGKPIIFGPYMENFAALARALVGRGGAIQISSPAELQQSIVDLLRNTVSRERLVENARGVLEMHAGATQRTAALIVDLRPTRTASS
jgi:3-deoxy-D-manno-octulosonic-acid transferase